MGMLIFVLICVIAGAYIGWNVPQPEIAKKAQDYVLGLLGKKTETTENRDSNDQQS
jgi:hypothetical protein